MRMTLSKPERLGRTLAVLAALAVTGFAGGCGGGGVGGGGGTPQAQAVLRVTSSPAGARIFLNGTDTTKTAPNEITVDVATAGTAFEVKGSLETYEDAVQTVTALPNQVVDVALVLQPTNPPDVPPHTITGRVTANGTATSTATVTATDGVETYTAVMDTARPGTYYIFAPGGTYTVTAAKSGFQSQQRTVTLVSGEDRKTGIDFALTP